MLKNKRLINSLIIIAAFLGFVYIMYTIPFCSDDWSWGGVVGIQRLQSHFSDYNGRYFGNLLIMLLTKSNLIKTIGMAVISFSVVYLAYKFIDGNDIFYFFFVLMLLFAMPSNIFRQTMAWASGLANYIPPVMFSLIYLIIVKNIFEKEKPEYSKILIPLSFLIGVCGNLFMEHVTIMNFALSVLVVFYVYLKYKKFFAVHISNLIGNIVGALIMFTNTAYTKILTGHDSYRTFGDKSKTVLNGLHIICSRFYENNVIINILISVMLLALIINCINKNYLSKKQKRVAIICNAYIFAFSIYSVVLTYAYFPQKTFTSEFAIILRTVLCVLFLVAVAVIPIVCVKDRDEIVKIIFPTILICVLTLPLIVITPVTGRCFYPCYIMLMLYCVNVLKYLLSNFSEHINKKAVFSLVLVGVVIGCVFYGVKYTKINEFENERNSFVSAQIKQGNKTVYLPHYPKSLESYTEGTTPRLFRWDEMWEVRYKDFYGIDSSISVRPISYHRYQLMKNKK